jgi:hypothetical protein
MTTHYTRSNGAQVEIASMIYHHLVSAHAKLVRERVDDSRDAEIEAMAARIAELDAEHEAEAQTRPGAA